MYNSICIRKHIVNIFYDSLLIYINRIIVSIRWMHVKIENLFTAHYSAASAYTHRQYDVLQTIKIFSLYTTNLKTLNCLLIILSLKLVIESIMQSFHLMTVKTKQSNYNTSIKLLFSLNRIFKNLQSSFWRATYFNLVYNFVYIYNFSKTLLAIKKIWKLNYHVWHAEVKLITKKHKYSANFQIPTRTFSIKIKIFQSLFSISHIFSF